MNLKGEPTRLCRSFLFRRSAPILVDDPRQPRNGAVIEELPNGHIHIEIAPNSVDDAERGNGVATQRDEICSSGNPLDPEHARPDPCQGRLRRTLIDNVLS